jgi:serine/threonine protein kinase
MFGTEGDVGLDTTMIRGLGSSISAIMVNGRKFYVDRMIYRMQSFVGQGTQVWVVRQSSKNYILKNSWVQSGRVGSEIMFLKLMQGHAKLESHVPNLIEGEDVKINGVSDSTERYRVNVGQHNFYRIHRRLVTEPIGEPLVRFQSRAEFLNVMIELIEGEYLYHFSPNVLKLMALTVLDYLKHHVGILHRDISPNNILLVRDASGIAKCLLIDFDYAVCLDAELKASCGFRTVGVLLSTLHCYSISNNLGNPSVYGN